MMKYAVKFSMFLAFFSLSFFTSCDKSETESQEVEAFVDQALLSVAESASSGADGCYELVLPVSILFVDGTTAEVASIDEMKEAFRTWKENNPDATRKDRPQLVLPVDFIDDGGVIISVTTQEELKELRAACRKGHGPKKGKRGNKECSCFEIVFPLTISFSDGTTAEVNDRKEFKTTVRTWKENNPDATERPEVVFPITVQLEDGTTTEVNNEEELKALKEACRDGE